MIERLRDHPRELNALVMAVAETLGISESFIEKDFWAIEVLRVAVHPRPVALRDGGSAEANFLFKGGTSLSRAFNIVERFSEDIDLLAVFPDDSSPKARHAVLKQVDADVAVSLGVPGVVAPGSSDTGVKRYTRYAFPAQYADTALTDGVLLELGSRGGTQPAETASIRSLLAETAIARLGLAVDEWQEFEEFGAKVLAPERTLLEKLSALHTAVATGDGGAALRSGRHLYDVYRLLGDARVLAALQSLSPIGVAELAQDVHQHSLDAGFTSEPRPTGGFAESPAFSEHKPKSDALARGYVAIGALVYGEFPSFATVLGRIAAHRRLL